MKVRRVDDEGDRRSEISDFKVGEAARMT